MKPNPILFIPFAASENNASLYARALKWIQNYKDANKLQKIPSIIIYRLPTETDADYVNMPSASSFPVNMDPNTVVYVLADGIGDTRFVSSSDQLDNLHFMSINLVAERAKKCGLSKISNIKLYVCEMNYNNDHLAINFAKALGTRFINTKITYYKTFISTPHELNGSTHKLALDHFENILGRAKDFKCTMHVARALFARTAVFSKVGVEEFIRMGKPNGLMNEVIIDDIHNQKIPQKQKTNTSPSFSNSSFGLYPNQSDLSPKATSQTELIINKL